MMPQRVLHLLGTAQAENAAICRMVAALAAGIDRAQYEVHAWFLDGDGPLRPELEAAGVRVGVVDWPGIRVDPLSGWRFMRALQRQPHRFSLIHQHWGSRSLRWLARLTTGSKIIAHFHSRVREPGSLEPVRMAADGADRVIAVSRAVSERVIGRRPQVIYPGVTYPPRPVLSEGSPQKPGLVIGTAGRLVPIKGLTYLLQALARLVGEFSLLQLQLAGTGPDQSDLETEARKLGLERRVVFLGWQSDLSYAMSDWDVFVLPSLDEGAPVALLEAMAHGLPVVASSVGGIPELVEDGRTGFLVPPRDVENLAGRLRILLLDRGKRVAMGAAGRERVRRYFTAERMIAEIAEMYAQLLRHPADG